MTAQMVLLPPAPDACPTCARKHAPEEPHDAQSLYWAVSRTMQGLPPPTWADALAHVTPELRAAWVTALGARGIVVNPRALTHEQRSLLASAFLAGLEDKAHSLCCGRDGALKTCAAIVGRDLAADLAAWAYEALGCNHIARRHEEHYLDKIAALDEVPR